MSRKVYLGGLALLVMLFAYSELPDSFQFKRRKSNPLFGDRTIFPPDNPWNRDVSKDPVDTNSKTLLENCGSQKTLHPDFGTFWEGRPNGFGFVIVPTTQPLVPVEFDYDTQSDPGPYPIPPDAPIEGGPTSVGDRHVIVIDKDAWRLYEVFGATPVDGGKRWKAGSGAVFDLSKNATRPPGWTSADAAGLAIFPGLVRYDEVVEQGEYHHAVRFTCRTTRRGYVFPASHFASSQTSAAYPPMGMRVRLKADFDISSFPPPVQVILTALKRYGMILADNGAPFYISGAHDPRWEDELLGTIRRVTRDSLEVLEMGPVTTRTGS